MKFIMQESGDSRETIPFKRENRFELPFAQSDPEFQELHNTSLGFRTFVERILDDSWCRENLETVGDHGMQMLFLRTYESRGAVGPERFIPIIVKQLTESSDLPESSDDELKRAG